MNDRLGIQDLIDILAKKHGIGRKDAEGFVKEFFQLIEDSLEADKYVRVKGLGTFKLIAVDSRESVNVNTGERFQIQGHTKVSFTPEPTLRDIINGPFSHFETVTLNEDTVLENTPSEEAIEEEESPVVEETRAMPEELETFTVEEIKFQETEKEEEPVFIPETVYLPEEQPEATPATISEIPQDTQPEAEVEKVPAQRNSSSGMPYFIAAILFVVLLCGAAVAYLYFPDMLESGMSDKKVQQTVETLLPAVQAEIQSEATSEVKTEQLVPQKDAPVPPIDKSKFEPDSTGYKIVGTEFTYKLGAGEMLTRVSQRFYGTKALWPYLVKHNSDIIRNPNNIPVGIELKIPRLEKVEHP